MHLTNLDSDTDTVFLDAFSRRSYNEILSRVMLLKYTPKPWRYMPWYRGRSFPRISNTAQCKNASKGKTYALPPSAPPSLDSSPSSLISPPVAFAPAPPVLFDRNLEASGPVASSIS